MLTRGLNVRLLHDDDPAEMGALLLRQAPQVAELLLPLHHCCCDGVALLLLLFSDRRDDAASPSDRGRGRDTRAYAAIRRRGAQRPDEIPQEWEERQGHARRSTALLTGTSDGMYICRAIVGTALSRAPRARVVPRNPPSSPPQSALPTLPTTCVPECPLYAHPATITPPPISDVRLTARSWLGPGVSGVGLASRPVPATFAEEADDAGGALVLHAIDSLAQTEAAAADRSVRMPDLVLGSHPASKSVVAIKMLDRLRTDGEWLSARLKSAAGARRACAALAARRRARHRRAPR